MRFDLMRFDAGAHPCYGRLMGTLRYLNIKAARRDLCGLVERLESDGPLVITRRGKPAGVLVPWSEGGSSVGAPTGLSGAPLFSSGDGQDPNRAIVRGQREVG